MSPTSCRCSTPRRVLAGTRHGLAAGVPVVLACAPAPPPARVGGARGGLASRGVAPTVLSGAALGHDRVRDGTGWGQHALGHGHPPPPHADGRDPCIAAPRSRRERSDGSPPAPGGSPARPAPSSTSLHTTRLTGPPAPRRGWAVATRRVVAPPAGAGRPAAAVTRTGRDRYAGAPPSTIRTARLRSVARRPPAAYQPGHLPGVLPLMSGEARLGEGFPLRCFQRFARPHVATQRCRLRDNWHTSGASTPVLSY